MGARKRWWSMLESEGENRMIKQIVKVLKEIQETADNRAQQIISEPKVKSDLTEDMKNTDMFYWVCTMNSIKAQAEEIVFSELIYV